MLPSLEATFQKMLAQEADVIKMVALAQRRRRTTCASSP